MKSRICPAIPVATNESLRRSMPLCLFLAVTLRRGNNQGARSRDGGGGGTVSEVELAARGRRRRLSQSPWRRKHTALPSRSVRPSRVSLRRPSSTKSPCHSYGDPDTASTSQATICRSGGCGVDGCWYRLGDAGGRHVSLEDTLGLHRCGDAYTRALNLTSPPPATGLSWG